MSRSRFQSKVWQSHRCLLILVMLMILIFLLQMILGPRFDEPFMVVPKEVTKSFEQITQGMFSFSALAELGTLFSYAFLHGSIDHLLFNMIFFWMFGALVFELLGKQWFLLLFFFTSLTGGICHVAMNTSEVIPMLGASGAVMGFEGAYLAMALRWHLPQPYVWPIARPIAPTNLMIFALIGIARDYMGIMGGLADFTAYGAHIGGFLGGVFIAGFLAPRPSQARVRA